MIEPKYTKKLRILFSTNAQFSPSGYAQQAAELFPLIVEEGYPLACTAFYGVEGGMFYLDGVKMYPKLAHPFGGDALHTHAGDFKADIVMTLQDLWVIEDEHLKQIPCRFVPIVPVDHEPIPLTIFNKLRLAYKIVTYSKFGHAQLENLGMNSTFIPHTVNTEIFKPLDKEEQMKIRKALTVPDDIFLFGMVAANKDNPSRKSFQEVLDAFKIFQEKHPKSGIYFHVLLEQAGGFPIATYANAIRLKNIFNTPPYQQLFKTTKQDMAKIYNTFDCLLAPSTNGGFEVPIIEAAACGKPVITNDWTAMRDLVEDGVTGFKTKVAFKRYTQLQSYIGIPDMMSIYDCMEKVYAADRNKLGEAGRKMVVAEYDTKTVYKTKWSGFFAKLESEVYNDTIKNLQAVQKN